MVQHVRLSRFFRSLGDSGEYETFLTLRRSCKGTKKGRHVCAKMWSSQRARGMGDQVAVVNIVAISNLKITLNHFYR